MVMGQNRAGPCRQQLRGTCMYKALVYRLAAGAQVQSWAHRHTRHPPGPAAPTSRSVAAVSAYSSGNGSSQQVSHQRDLPGGPQESSSGGVDAGQLHTMLASGEFELGGVAFTLASARAYISTRLRAYAAGERVSSLDEDMLLQLIKFHPRYSQKVGQSGISHFTIQRSERGTHCFYLHRNDGTSSDFSYVKSLAAYAYMHITRQVDAIGNPTGPIPDLPPLPALPSKKRRSRDSQHHASRRTANRRPNTASIPEEMLQALDAELDPLVVAPTVGQVAARGQMQQQQQQQQQAHAPLSQQQFPQQVIWSSSDDWASSSLEDLAYASWDDGVYTSTHHSPAGYQTSPATWPVPGQRTQTTQRYTQQQQQQQQQTEQQQQRSMDGQLSWKECMLALRTAVAPQLRQYKAQQLAAGGIVCQATGQPLTADTAMVAYQPPNDFKQLVVGWMKHVGLANKEQLVIGRVGELQHPSMQDEGQIASWLQYHSQHARLCIVHRSQRGGR